MTSALARVGMVACVVVVANGCNESARDHGAPIATHDPSAPAFDTLVRPDRTYLASNDKNLCSVYWRHGKQRSKPATIRCPRELEPGEKMRLAGQSCLRESPTPGRATPVRCTSQLFYMRDADASGGELYPEFRLAPKPGG
jgi:hypothetical protein